MFAQQLREFNHDNWVHLRNREDFDRIYLLADEERIPLEDVYKNGRDMAGQLSYLLMEFNYVAEYPTFRSFVDAVARYVTEEAPRLRGTVARAQEVLPDLEQPPWAVPEMIRLCEQQLEMAEELSEWSRRVRSTALYRAESGEEEAPTSGRDRFRAFRDHPIIVGIIVALVSGVILAIL